MGEDLELAEVTIESGSQLDGATIREKGAAHESIAMIALKRTDCAPRMRPDPDERLHGGDVLLVVGDAVSINGLQRDAALRVAA